jgi:hypothetical protein
MSIILYAILGAVLSFAGVNIIDSPLPFIVIMANVILIDVAGRTA